MHMKTRVQLGNWGGGGVTPLITLPVCGAISGCFVCS